MFKDPKEYNILIVEDNPGDFLIAEELIKECFINSDVVQATNFTDARSKISDDCSSYDIILLDLTLPDISGNALVTGIIALCPVCPIIILTGYADIEFSIKSIGLGISDYLLKDELSASILQKSISYAVERMKIRGLLRASEKRYSDIFQLSPLPMLVFDADTHRFCQVNEAATNLYGYTEDEFLQLHLTDVKEAEDVISIKNIDKENAELEKRPINGQFRHYNKSGKTIEVEIVSTSLMLNNSILRLAIVNDVTEKNHFERTLAKAIIQTQESERIDVGAELHDNVCQILATSKLRLGMLQEDISSSGQLLISQSKADLKLAISEIRKLSHRLAPAFYDTSTLQKEFTTLLQMFSIEDKTCAELHIDETFDDSLLSKELKLNLYRILQEHSKNIVAHAMATTVDVRLLIQGNAVNMNVSENGVGFDTALATTGIGFANMKRRAGLFGGTVTLNSSPGSGSVLSVTMPFS